MLVEKCRTQLDKCTESIEVAGVPLPDGLSTVERFLLYQLMSELKTNALSVTEMKSLTVFVKQMREERTKQKQTDTASSS